MTKECLNKTQSLLKESVVDIWYVDLSKVVPIKKDILSKEEQHRADRFHFPHHRQRFIAAHTSLRKILANYLLIDAADIVFAEGKYGKPFVKNQTRGLQFNLSHSQNTALIAITKNKELGVDIEYFSKRDLIGIAKHSFSPQEQRALQELNEDKQQAVFFHIWAQKEAFIKAKGQGLRYPLASFSVSPFPPAAILQLAEGEKNHWFIESFVYEQKAYCALCTSLPVTKVNKMTYTFYE